MSKLQTFPDHPQACFPCRARRDRGGWTPPPTAARTCTLQAQNREPQSETLGGRRTGQDQHVQTQGQLAVQQEGGPSIPPTRKTLPLPPSNQTLTWQACTAPETAGSMRVPALPLGDLRPATAADQSGHMIPPPQIHADLSPARCPCERCVATRLRATATTLLRGTRQPAPPACCLSRQLCAPQDRE